MKPAHIRVVIGAPGTWRFICDLCGVTRCLTERHPPWLVNKYGALAGRTLLDEFAMEHAHRGRH